MAQRFAGVALINVDGQQLALRGNFTVSASPVERTMLAGQDRVHGYQELPRVPYIEGDISTVRDQSLETLDRQTNVTVVAQLANGKQYTLSGATCKAALENNTRDGQVRVRWEGLWCDEQQLGDIGVGPGVGFQPGGGGEV
jgi:Phage tail tube protein